MKVSSRLPMFMIAFFALWFVMSGCALPGTGANSTNIQTADISDLARNMQGTMAGMQSLMQSMQATPMSPEMMNQMQGMMAGMQGMMGNMQGMQGMPGMVDMPETMAEMESMMAQMQGFMDQMHASGTEMPIPGMPMGGMMMDNAPVVPAGVAFSEGQEIRFIHTETSDPEIAQLLSDMMASPVLVVPSLADMPPAAQAPVYVFTNGPAGTGPLGFQPDVFPDPPGSEGYTPLRTVHLVTWLNPADARLLTSATEVTTALAAGELAEEITGVVVNMPFLSWPDGQR
jgi:hypothetical protein